MIEMLTYTSYNGGLLSNFVLFFLYISLLSVYLLAEK